MPKAIQMHHYGAPQVLQLADVTLPPLQPNEVRFRVIAAAVNRADLEIRSGKWPILAPQPFPYTPGLEALGEVIEWGRHVRRLTKGEWVITMMQQLGGIHGLRPGGYQETVTVEADKVAVIPPHLDPFDVAALGLAAVTAYNGLKRLHLQAGQTVVIHGASGGVGSAAVSIAKVLGARVIATTSSPAKANYLYQIGADEVVSLGQQRLTDQLGPRSVDAVLEMIGQRTFADSVAVLKRGGRLCLVGAASGENLHFIAWDLLQDLQLTGYSSENLTGPDLRADIAHICGWLTGKQVAAPPYRKYPLSEAAKVHALMEQGKLTGRALLVP